MSDTASPTSPAGAVTKRLPFVVPLLALGTFLMCTTEYIIAGLLPQMAHSFDVGLAQAGLLITAFATGMVIGAPVMALATVRLPRRRTLLWALGIFAAGHVVAALSASFAVMLAARVLTALATGAFWSVASIIATTAAGPEAQTRALGVMMSGVGMATIAGVPLGALAGQAIGWRGAFWALAILTLVTAVVIGRFAPADETQTATSAAAQLRALGSSRLWAMLGATVLVVGGYMATFSYISPLLMQRAGFPGWAIPLALIAYGAGSLIGTNVSGRFADRRPFATFITAAIGATLVMALLVPLSVNSPATIVLLVLLGVTGMAVPPITIALAVRFASAAPTVAAGLSVSAFNAGIAAGAWIAGIALDSSGPTGPAMTGAVMAGMGVIPLTLLAIRIRAARRMRRTGQRPATVCA
jgi:DHA1 family inner membrane transport protein